MFVHDVGPAAEFCNFAAAEERERSNFYLDLHFAFPQITNRDPMTQYYKTGLGRRLEPYLRLSNTRYT